MDSISEIFQMPAMHTNERTSSCDYDPGPLFVTVYDLAMNK